MGMYTYFLYASDPQVTIYQQAISASAREWLCQSLSFQAEQFEKAVSIEKFGSSCNGKFYAYMTPEVQSAWNQIATTVSAPVSLYFYYEEGFPFRVDLSPKESPRETSEESPISGSQSGVTAARGAAVFQINQDSKWYKILQVENSSDEQILENSPNDKEEEESFVDAIPKKLVEGNKKGKKPKAAATEEEENKVNTTNKSGKSRNSERKRKGEKADKAGTTVSNPEDLREGLQELREIGSEFIDFAKVRIGRYKQAVNQNEIAWRPVHCNGCCIM